MEETVRLQDCPHQYQLVRVVFLDSSSGHFMLAAPVAAGWWAYLDSGFDVEHMSLQQLEQKRGHQVVGVLLISNHQPEDDGRLLLANFLRGQQHQLQQASGLPR